MITLEQAIKLAAEAHKDQCRKPIPLMTNEYKSQAEYLGHCGKGKLELPNGNYLQINTEDKFEIIKPYITHPLAVMNMMSTDEEKIVAVLHDVFEMNKNYKLKKEEITKREWHGDFSTTYKFYIKSESNSYEITSNIYVALKKLTNKDSSNYLKYICKMLEPIYDPYWESKKTMLNNSIWIKVKIADIMHNMSESNDPKQKEKYLNALPILLKAL